MDGGNISSFGFMIGTEINNLEKVEVYKDISWTDFFNQISTKDYYKSLSPSTKYFIRWYSTIDTDYYSDIYSFTTNNKPSVIKGDCNADGKFTIADIVMLQKWIMGHGSITIMNNGDLDGNSRINVLDLCIMKRELINK